MKRNQQLQFGWLAMALAATAASAQTQNEAKSAQALSTSEEPSLNHFGVAFRAGFNIKSSFKNIGGFPEWIVRDPSRPQDRTYADGYVRTDALGNDHSVADNPATAPYKDTTWYWAYANAAAQTEPVPGSVLMHSDSSAPIASTQGEKDDPLPGFELTFSRQLGKLGKARWGVEAAFGYMGFDFKDHASYPVSVARRTDQYDFPPMVGDPKLPDFPPDPSPSGSFGGPGQLLGDAIIFSTSNPNFGSTLVAGQRRFEGNIFSGRLGPYLEIPLGKRFSFSFSGGLALVGVHSSFSYDESVTIMDPVAGALTERHNASGSHGDVLVGGYLSGSFAYAFCSRASVFVGAQFQSVGTYTHALDNVGSYTQLLDQKAAKLDLSQSVFLTVGLNYAF